MSFGINGTVFLPPKPLKQGKLVEKTCEFVKVGLYRAHVTYSVQIVDTAVHFVTEHSNIGCLYPVIPQLSQQ